MKKKTNNIIAMNIVTLLMIIFCVIAIVYNSKLFSILYIFSIGTIFLFIGTCVQFSEKKTDIGEAKKSKDLGPFTIPLRDESLLVKFLFIVCMLVMLYPYTILINNYFSNSGFMVKIFLLLFFTAFSFGLPFGLGVLVKKYLPNIAHKISPF